MAKRIYCDKCNYPRKTCICDLLVDIKAPDFTGEIHILQHPAEAKHSKNSVRILKLLMPGITLWCGETAEDFATLEHLIQQEPFRWACIFPSPHSQDIETIKEPIANTKLIFIDATWRKARKIRHLNPWLATLPCWHLPETSQQQYHIRKSPKEHHLSTLEAVAMAIQIDCDSQPILTAFQAFQERFYQFAAKDNQ